jgi:hypothetical protein
VDAVVKSQFLFKVKRLVVAFLVLVTDDLVRAGNDAPCAPGAEAGVDDLLV